MADSILSLIMISANTVAERPEGILLNPGFEQPLEPEWTCLGCTASWVTDAQSGNRSFRASGRTEIWHGPTQVLTGLSGSRTYRFTGYVRLLQSSPYQEPQDLRAALRYTKPDFSEELVGIAHVGGIEPSDGWVWMESEFYIWEVNQTTLEIIILDPAPGINFQVDTLSIVDVGPTIVDDGILNNPGFENPLGGSGWLCKDCKGALIEHSHTGRMAYKAYDRTESWVGPFQDLQLGAGAINGTRIYRFTGYVKVLPTPLPQSHLGLEVILIDLQSEEDKVESVWSAYNVHSSDGWVPLEAVFHIQEVPEKLGLAIIASDAGVDFLLDTLSIVDVGAAVIEPADEVLRNPGFENPIGGSGWFCFGGCSGTLVDDSHTGRKAYKAIDRNQHTDGLAQYLWFGSDIFRGQSYRLSGYVKMLPSLFNVGAQTLRASIGYERSRSDTTWDYIASVDNVEPADGWVLMTAEFSTPGDTLNKILFTISGPDTRVSFMVDTLSISEIL